MAETHELRLKINAAAAKAGSREFVAAITSIKRSIIELDRLSDGTFKKLSKNARAAGKAASVTIKPVDRTALRSLDSFTKIQAQALRQTANTRQGIRLLMDNLRTVATAYGVARTANEAYTQSLTRSLSVLTRQAQLIGQVGTAARSSGAAGTTAATTRKPDSRAGDQQVAMQNRIKRAVADTRVSVERLTVSLMKVGGFQQIQQVGQAFRDFQREVSKASVSTRDLDTAKTKLSGTMKTAQAAAITLNAKLQEEQRITKAVADAARLKAKANQATANAAKAATAAATAQNAALGRQEKILLSAAAANRRATEEVTRLTERMRRMGDTRGIAQLTTALNQFRTATAGGVQSATKLRTATSSLSDATSRAKVSLIAMEGAQARATRSARDLSQAESAVAKNARRVEREMRSIAGASNAASRSMRNATGSLRGMENAFSATFQIGSAFRTMIGTITFGTFVQGVFAAGRALEQFRVTMEVATGSMAGAMEQMNFIDNMARVLGTGLRGAREDFSKFAVSANLAGVEASTARDIFRSVSQAMTVMGRGAEDQRLSFLALEQMLSKNVVSSEELRRQLGERLPGAVNLMARAVGVTTQELQKMLKAGELIAADVLPKFAREVDKAFGPGLERALTRAPAALGRFRNELEFFTSTVADSGFMDTLAAGFDRLTKAMQSPEAREAAIELGEGLSKLAEIAFNFAEAFATNIDRVGAVAKAILGGVIARQVALMAGALLTGASRSTLAFQQLTAAMTMNTTAMTAHTAALARTTTGNTALSAAQTKTIATTNALAASTTRSNIAMAATAGFAGRASVAMAGVSRVAGVAAAGMATVSRVFMGLAGPIGIGIAALSLLPLFFNKSAEAATDMADSVEAAVRRSGASLDELQSREFAPTSRTAFDSIIDDLETLDTRLQRMVVNNEEYGRSLLSIRNRMARGRESDTSIFARVERLDLSRIGVDGAQLDGLRDSTQRLVNETLELGQAALQGKGSWLAFYEEIQRTIRLDPASGPAMEGLATLIRANAEAELAAAAHREQLVALFGTDDDKAVVRFGQMALSALRAGEGFDKLRDEITDTIKTAPQLADRFSGVLDEISQSFARGVSIPQIRLELEDNFGEAAERLQGLRDEFERTQRSAASSAARFAETAQIITRHMIGMIPPEALDRINAMVVAFDDFENAALPVENLNLILANLEFPTAKAEAFSETVSRQFALLAPAQQTYDNLRVVMNRVGEESQFAGQGMEVFATEMANAASMATEAGANAEDFREAITAILVESGVASEEVDKLVGRMFASADASTEAARAGYEAEAGLIAAANGADQVSSGAAGAAAQIRALIAALDALTGSSTTVASAASKIVDDLNFAALQKAAPVFERQRNEFIRKQTAAITETYNAALAAEGATDGPIAARIRADMDAAEVAVQEGAAAIEAAATDLFNTEAWKDSTKARSTGGGGGSKADREAAAKATQNHAAAMKMLTKATTEYLSKLDEENAALAILASGMTTSENAARLLAEAQMNGANMTAAQTQAFIDQIEAADALNAALKRMANDPVNDWVNSVPTWREAGQQIERDVFDSLSETISKFIQTGEFSFEALGASILSTIADIVADKAVKELVNLLGGNTSGSGEGGFGLGGFLSNLFGNGGSAGDPADPFAGAGMGGMQPGQLLNELATGGQQAAEAIRQAMVSAGQQVGQQMRSAGTAAGAQMGTQVSTAGSIAGTTMGTSVTTSSATGAASMGTAITTASATGAASMGSGIVTGSQQGGGIFAQLFGGLFGGGGGGGGLGGIFSSLFGLFFKEGGLTSSPSSVNMGAPMALSAFRHAPSFADGTTNTSGIPAMLHNNEAVVPLSGNRKIPVAFSDDFADGLNSGSNTINQVFNIQTPDADSFRKSQKQIAAEAAGAGQRALGANT